MLNLTKLKIKAKHLATEPAIIRHEEKKLAGKYAASILRSHRLWDVKNEARATQLAIKYLKGHKYSSVEKKVHDKHKLYYVVLPRILSMVKNYGDRKATREDIISWLNE